MDERLQRNRALELWQEGYRQHMFAFVLARDQRDEMAAEALTRAIELYSDSIEIFPTAEAYTFRGWAYQSFGRVDDAIEECKHAIAVDPAFGNPYNDIGAYLISKGNLDEAVEWLEKAKRAPRYEPRHYPYQNLARVYRLKGMMMKAIAELEQAQLCVSDNESASVIREQLETLRSSLN